MHPQKMMELTEILHAELLLQGLNSPLKEI